MVLLHRGAPRLVEGSVASAGPPTGSQSLYNNAMAAVFGAHDGEPGAGDKWIAKVAHATASHRFARGERCGLLLSCLPSLRLSALAARKEQRTLAAHHSTTTHPLTHPGQRIAEPATPEERAAARLRALLARQGGELSALNDLAARKRSDLHADHERLLHEEVGKLFALHKMNTDPALVSLRAQYDTRHYEHCSAQPWLAMGLRPAGSGRGSGAVLAVGPPGAAAAGVAAGNGSVRGPRAPDVVPMQQRRREELRGPLRRNRERERD